MSRNYANFSTDIWRPGNDFGDLNMAAQWAYFMLSTQSDISAAGVLSLNIKRWIGRTKDGTREAIVRALQELQAAGKVVYDTDTEELLVRTFVKWDGGYNNRKRRPVIERAARDIESLGLRRVLAVEFAKLELPVEWLGLPIESGADSLSGSYGIAHTGEPATPILDGPTVPTQRTPETTFPQVNRLSDSPSRFDGVAVIPQPSTLNPQVIPPSAATTVAIIEPLLFGETPEPETEASPTQRAFGLARYWIDARERAGTPVIARGKNGPLHILKNLIKPFAEGSYTDDEIKQALTEIGESAPSSAQLDRALTRIRSGKDPRSNQGRRNGSLASDSRRSMVRDTHAKRDEYLADI